MNFQTSKRIMCCLMAALILCCAVVRPIEARATGLVAAVAGVCGISVETLTSIVVTALAVGHIVEYVPEVLSNISTAIERYSSFVSTLQGKTTVPVYTYNSQIYVPTSVLNNAVSSVADSFQIVYGEAWELGKQYDFYYSVQFGSPAYDLVIWTNSNVYTKEGNNCDIVCCSGPCVAYMNPSSSKVQVSPSDWDYALWGDLEFAFNGQYVSQTYKNSVASIAETWDPNGETIVITDPYTDEDITAVAIGALTAYDVIDLGRETPVVSGVTSPEVTPGTGTVDLTGILSWLKSIWSVLTGLASAIFTPIVDAINVTKTAIITSIESIIEWLISIGASLADILTWIQSLPIAIAQAISDVLSAIFVPSEDFLTVKVEALRARFDWINPFIDFAKSLSFSSAEPPVIYIPLADAEGSYYFGPNMVFVDMSWYARYKAAGDLILSGFFWALFGWRMYVKLPGIINGVAGTIGRFG